MTDRLLKLYCTFSPAEEAGMVVVHSTMYDGTAFDFKINEVLANYSSDSKKEGWVQVVSTGQQGNRLAITLPTSSVRFGKQVTVNAFQVAPINVSLDMFKQS